MPAYMMPRGEHGQTNSIGNATAASKGMKVRSMPLVREQPPATSTGLRRRAMPRQLAMGNLDHKKARTTLTTLADL